MEFGNFTTIQFFVDLLLLLLKSLNCQNMIIIATLVLKI